MSDGGVERKIGVLGGTFDPVHLGHLAVARFVQQQLVLDEVLFIPACRPPHKMLASIAPFPARLEMLQLALRNQPGFLASDLEAARSGPSYSVDTLRELHYLYGPGQRFFFVIGLDAFLDVHTWKDFLRLPFLADLVVINRSDYSLARVEAMVGCLGNFQVDQARSSWKAAGIPGEIRLLTMPPVEISSTLVRKVSAAGGTLTQLVTAEVAAYIREHQLYGAGGSGSWC